MKEVKLSVTGMSCGHCVETVKDLIHESQGLVFAEVDLAAAQATVILEGEGDLAIEIVNRINTKSQYKSEIQSL